MSIQRFSAEFKEEAVRQFVARGYKSPRAVNGRPSILSPNKLSREFTVDATDRVPKAAATWSAS